MNSKYFRIATYRKLLPTYTTQSEYNSHERSSESSFRFCRIKAYSWSPVDRSLLLSVWGVMLHATKTWAVIVDINRLVKNDNVMVRWIWPSKIMHKRHMADLNKHLGISSLEIILRRGRWRWFGQVKRMDGNQECCTLMSRVSTVDGQGNNGWTSILQTSQSIWSMIVMRKEQPSTPVVTW